MEPLLTPEMSVGGAVAAHPEIVPMLETLGIDYCCGGKASLAQAAEATGMPQETLLAVLRTTIQEARREAAHAPDWTTAPLDTLMEHIVQTHHTFMRRELPRIAELLARVRRAHGEAHGEMLDQLMATFAALRAEIEEHLADEEERTFPLIRAAAAGARDPAMVAAVSELEHEHESAGVALANLRALTGDFHAPADACTTFCVLYDALQAMERDLHQHIHLENNILFPRARQMMA